MNFSIISNLNTRDYIKVMYIGLYKKPVFIIAAFVGLYYFVTVSLNYLGLIEFYDSPPLFEIFGGLFLLFVPTLIVLLSVGQFKSNPSLQHDITYTFSDETVAIEGLTFKSELLWAHIIKHKEIGRFLVLYHTKRFGNFIDMNKLTPEQLCFIKEKTRKK